VATVCAPRARNSGTGAYGASSSGGEKKVAKELKPKETWGLEWQRVKENNSWERRGRDADSVGVGHIWEVTQLGKTRRRGLKRDNKGKKNDQKRKRAVIVLDEEKREDTA